MSPTIKGPLALLLFLCAHGLCDGQSIWQHRKPERVFLLSDTAARRVGDLITILISENTNVANKDQRNMDKGSSAKFDFDFSSSSSSPVALDVANKSDRSFSGQSNYTVDQEFSDRMTVEVLDVLPNGNLVIGGRRQRIVAGELRTLVISGSVRYADVSPNNTVRSQYVANFRVCYDGDGPESHFSNQGWGERILNRIWPF